MYAIKLEECDKLSFEQGKKSGTRLTKSRMLSSQGREVLLRLSDAGSMEFRGEERRARIQKVETHGHVTEITFVADPLPGEVGKVSMKLRVNGRGELLTLPVRGTRGIPVSATNPAFVPPKPMKPSRVCGYVLPFRRQLMLA